jgi:hypothetical protein
MNGLWAILYCFSALYMIALVLYMGTVLYYRFQTEHSSAWQTPKPHVARTAVDDLLLQRMTLLALAFLYVLFSVIASIRVNFSPLDCFWWNFAVTATIGLEKYALFLFLFCKQDVLKKTIHEQRTTCDVFILIFMHLLPILAIITAATAKVDFDIASGCKPVTTTLMLTTYGLSTIVDIVVSVTLLRSFLGVIKKHVNVANHEKKTSKDVQKLSKISSEEGAQVVRKGSSPEGLSITRFNQIHQIMEWNSRSCILSICSFFFTVIWSVAIPMFISDSNIYLPLIGTIGCTDMFIDGTAMLMCSPQIWQSIWRKVVPGERDTIHSTNRDNKRKQSGAQSVESLQLKEPAFSPQIEPM